MTEVYNITNTAEHVIREGLGSVLHSPVKLLGLKQIKHSFFVQCIIKTETRI